MINTNVKLSQEIEQKLSQLSDEVHIVLDFSYEDGYKVIVKAKYNGSYYITQGNSEYNVTVNDLIDDCIINLQELLAYAELVTPVMPKISEELPFSEKLRLDIQRRHITYEEYARNVGCAQSSLSRYCHGAVPRDRLLYDRIMKYINGEAL